MDELEAIRMKKLQEMQSSINNQQINEQMQQEAMLQQLEAVESAVKQHMTKEAVSRYGNIKTAYPEKAMQALMIMARAIETRQITKIDDALLKHFLEAMTPAKHEFRLTRV
jgi:DNA-binding TFAR19-related protein (PDSD5 family)